MALQRRSSVEWRQRRALLALIAAALMLRSSVAHTHQFSPLSLCFPPSFLSASLSVRVSLPISPSTPCLGRTNRCLNPTLFLPLVADQWGPGHSSAAGCRPEYNPYLAANVFAGGMAEMPDSWRTPDRMLISKFTVEHIDWVAYRFKIRKNSGIFLFKKIR